MKSKTGISNSGKNIVLQVTSDKITDFLNSDNTKVVEDAFENNHNKSKDEKFYKDVFLGTLEEDVLYGCENGENCFLIIGVDEILEEGDNSADTDAVKDGTGDAKNNNKEAEFFIWLDVEVGLATVIDFSF